MQSIAPEYRLPADKARNLFRDSRWRSALRSARNLANRGNDSESHHERAMGFSYSGLARSLRRQLVTSFLLDNRSQAASCCDQLHVVLVKRSVARIVLSRAAAFAAAE